MKESDIVYAVGLFWVFRDVKKSQYTVFRTKFTHSESDSAYPLNADGLSIAKARVDYMHKRHGIDLKVA